MTATPDAARVATARRWYRRQGYDAIVADGITAVVTPAHPDTWDANWLQAEPDATPAAVFAALDRHHPTGWQVVVVDALTPPDVEAALALADFRVEVTVIEMVADRLVAPPASPAVTLEQVDAASWDRLAELVRIDHREGKRTGAYNADVSAGLLDGMRRELTLSDYWLLVAHGSDAGYGMTARCPNGLGLIENLFTLPDRRGRGLMSAFIVEAAARLRAGGCDAVFLDAHVHDTPKKLYARLGFQPVAVTRTWVRQVN
jgi:GNAT superfamily N-acetyltransferase